MRLSMGIDIEPSSDVSVPVLKKAETISSSLEE